MTLGSFEAETRLLELDDSDFRNIAELIYDRFGIYLPEKKKALVQGRLHKVVKAKGYGSFAKYFDSLRQNESATELLDLIDSISTNHSFFFREKEHFDYLMTSVLPKLRDNLRRQEDGGLRIWCAGCAAGQEAYTIAMVLYEFFGSDVRRWQPAILGTDISVSSLSQAVEAVYPEQQAVDMPARYRRYFRPVGDGKIKVADQIREMVMFKRLNLKQDQYPFKGKFHLIFCRNVMIYFDRETREDLVMRFARFTHDGGYLFIGHSESLGRDIGGYRYIRPTVYGKWERRYES